MLIKTPDDIRPSEITAPEVFARRRDFLRAAAMLGLGAVVGPTIAREGSRPRISMAPDQQEAGPGAGLKLTDYEHVIGYSNFYEFGTAKTDPAKNAHTLRTRPWRVVVDGECEAPGEIDIEDILSDFTQQERIYRLRCVEAWMMVIPWQGFQLSELLQRFRPTSRAKYVAFETLHDAEQMPGQRRAILDWPYREGLRIDEAMHPLTILATGLYGETLPNQNGAPLRLVVPWKYGFKSIKSIVRITFTEQQPYTSWSDLAPHEYGFFANVNPDVDHPRWSQASHRDIGADLLAGKQATLMFNGYADQVADLYRGMDLTKLY